MLFVIILVIRNIFLLISEDGMYGGMMVRVLFDMVVFVFVCVKLNYYKSMFES